MKIEQIDNGEICIKEDDKQEETVVMQVTIPRSKYFRLLQKKGTKISWADWLVKEILSE